MNTMNQGVGGGGGGGGGEARFGTEKRCSHNLQSGHPAWWSAGNWCFSNSKYFDRSEKQTGRGND